MGVNVTPQSVLPASLWAATACSRPDYQPIPRERHVDVAVIGGGYTGLSSALHLAQTGVETCVVEASEPGWGASGRNGGQIISGLKFEPDQLEATFGPALGPRIVETMGGSGALVRSLVERYGMDCHASFNGWIQAAHGHKAMERTARPRAEQWGARGVATRLLDRDETARLVGTPRNLYVGGWLDARGGVIQPFSYARGLAAAAMREGASVHALSPARNLRREGEGWTFEAGSGRIRARRVILATNAYTDDLWPDLRRTVVPVTSFQVATHPLPPELRETIIPGGQGVTDTRRLLHYFRLDHEGRLVMGGRCPVDDSPSMEDAAALQSSIARTFPQAAGTPIQFLWSGKVALTKDSLPHIHMLAPGLYAALGCNGRGVGNCTMIGKVLAEFVAGAAPEEIALPVTAPEPFALHGFRKVGVLVATQYYRLLDRLEAGRG